MKFLPGVCVTASAMLSCFVLKAQDKDDLVLFLFNKDWQHAKNVEETKYFMQLVKESDTAYICRYYTPYGPMLRQESYADSDLTVPNGRFCWYNAAGDLDSVGWMDHGVRERDWYVYRDGRKIIHDRYSHGKRTERTDYENDRWTGPGGLTLSLFDKRRQDSLREVSRDTIVILDQADAEFEGGIRDWMEYINRNLKTPERLAGIHGAGRFPVVVSFQVDRDGYTGDIYLVHSCEWSGDSELIRLIERSPRWEPARKYGNAVAYRQLQTVFYEVK